MKPEIPLSKGNTPDEISFECNANIAKLHEYWHRFMIRFFLDQDSFVTGWIVSIIAILLKA